MVASLNIAAPTIVHETRLTSLQCVHRGKVRDVYAIDEHSLLIIATDRLSAFDVILPDPIPGKGRILNSISNFWFAATSHIIRNHLLDRPLAAVLPDAAERAQAEGRGVIARRLRALPIEAVVRGYLIGSAGRTTSPPGQVCGITLPRGLRQAEKLPETIFTPATKAAVGDHDENISFEAAAGWWARRWPRGCATPPLPCTTSPPHMPQSAASSSPTPSSNSAWRPMRTGANR